MTEGQAQHLGMDEWHHVAGSGASWNLRADRPNEGGEVRAGRVNGAGGTSRAWEMSSLKPGSLGLSRLENN